MKGVNKPWRGKGEKPEHVKRQQERQAQAERTRLTYDPGELIQLSITARVRCPLTRNEFELSTPRPRYHAEELAGLTPEQRREPDRPWNAPQLGLTGFDYGIGDMTTVSGVNLTVWHCPECGGRHEIEISHAL